MSLNRDTPGALAGGRAEQRRPTAAHGTHITLLLINHVLILIKMVVCWNIGRKCTALPALPLPTPMHAHTLCEHIFKLMSAEHNNWSTQSASLAHVWVTCTNAMYVHDMADWVWIVSIMTAFNISSVGTGSSSSVIASSIVSLGHHPGTQDWWWVTARV